MSRRLRADLALAFVAFIWGVTFVLVKNALTEISPLLFLTLRFSLAAIALLIVFRVRGAVATEGWAAGILVGLFLFAGYALQTFGLRLTTPAKSGFITGFYIPLVPLFSAVVYRKAPQLSEWLGVLVAFVGLCLLTLKGLDLHMNEGDLLTTACAVAYGCHILLLGHYSRIIGYEWLSLMQIGTCAVIGLATFWWVETPVVHWTPQVWVALAVTSLLATALSFLLQTWAQRETTPTRTVLIFALEPVFAWLTSYLIADEVLSRRAMAGALCILAGIPLAELKPFDRREHPEGVEY
jgi:drug/metabolite transporter (DMT)-like permease